MTIWYKQGVFGELSPQAAKGLRLTEKLYARLGKDVYVTSVRDGSHMAGSFHTTGDAWDMRQSDVPREQHRDMLGKDFDIIDHGDGNNFHRHVEYDPK